MTSPRVGVDWALQANDGTPTNAFFLRDITGSTTPFSVFAGAPTDALKVAGNGNIGLGTDAPGLDLSIRTTDTPAIRMEQTNGGGFTAQTWDIGANEANFFVRDLTGGSRLPFRIRPGAATSSLDIAANSNVGFGTASPAFPLDAVRTGVTGPMQRLANNGPSSLRFENTTAGGSKWDIGGGATDTFIVGPAGGAPALTVTPGGDATTGGVVQQSTATENAVAVDAADVLAKLRALPVTKSELASDPANALHLNPVGADFRAAFGLGSSDGAIAPSDMAGVALVGVQALAARVDDLDTSRVGSLGTRIDALEKAIAASFGSERADRAARQRRDGGGQARRQAGTVEPRDGQAPGHAREEAEAAGQEALIGRHARGHRGSSRLGRRGDGVGRTTRSSTAGGSSWSSPASRRHRFTTRASVSTSPPRLRWSRTCERLSCGRRQRHSTSSRPRCLRRSSRSRSGPGRWTSPTTSRSSVTCPMRPGPTRSCTARSSPSSPTLVAGTSTSMTRRPCSVKRPACWQGGPTRS